MSFKVDPFGEITNSPDRSATLMGNRGELRVDNKELVGLSRWQKPSWIYCSINKKFAPQPGDKPLKYTKLFFLDEYTALAAGHRPCGYCLPDRLEAFVSAWLAGNPEYGYGKHDIKRIDQVLHGERKNCDRSKNTYPAKLADLPDGVMVTPDVNAGECFLVQGGKLLKWSPRGYGGALLFDPDTTVQVLTPKSIVETIRTGFFESDI